MMSIQPVILWTDALLYVLLAVLVLTVWRVRRREHLRAPWRQVARGRMGMCALIVLLPYVVIGLLDSIHFREPLPFVHGQLGGVQYSTEVLSLLDKIASPLRERDEKTYSAPFATHLHVKETVEKEDGSQARELPRLRYGGRHLDDPLLQRNADILHISLKSIAMALAGWTVLAGLIIWVLAMRARVSYKTMLGEVTHGATELPWRVMLLTTSALMVLAVLCVELSMKYHILGTDKVGQDVFYLTLKSIRTGLVIGTLTTLIMLPFAVLLGIMAGYFRGIVDDVVQYLYTTLNSIPGVLLIAAAILMLQVYMATHEEMFDTLAQRADMRLLFLCIILGITSWTGLCRLLRGETLKLREMDYIQAATAFGVGHFKIITRHILPNVMHIVLITIVLDFSGLVLAEAVLAYVGAGVDPSTISWGNMINSARLEMAREPVVWWPLLAAFVFMLALVLAANLFADTVRDAFDPRLRKL
jgi:peptide/nickel transport system permease protein